MLIRVNNVGVTELRHEELLAVARQNDLELDLLVRLTRSDTSGAALAVILAPRKVSGIRAFSTPTF